MKRAVETTEEFKLRIAAIIGDKTKHNRRSSPTTPAIGAQEASDQNEETSSTMTVIKSVHEYEVRPAKIIAALI